MKARHGTVVLVTMVLLVLASGISSMAVADVVRGRERVERRERQVALRELALGAVDLDPGISLDWDGISVTRGETSIEIATARATWRFGVSADGRLGGATVVVQGALP